MLAFAVGLPGDDSRRSRRLARLSGTTGDGHAPDRQLPLEWSSTSNVVWKQPLTGEGWSSPVVAKGRIYLTSAVLRNLRRSKELFVAAAGFR